MARIVTDPAARGWMVSEVALNRARLHGGASPLRRVKLIANIAIGRVGMRLAQGQRQKRTAAMTPNVAIME